MKKEKSWVAYYRRRGKRSLSSFLTFLTSFFTILFFLLGFGFLYSSQNLESEAWKNLTNFRVEITEQETIRSDESPLVLIKNQRPNLEEVRNFLASVAEVDVALNFTYFLPHDVTIKGEEIVDYELLMFPHLEKVINLSQCQVLKRSTSFHAWDGVYLNDCFLRLYPHLEIGQCLDFEYDVEFEYEGRIRKVELSFSLLIEGIIEEFSFLNSPRIYGEYDFFSSLLKESFIPFDEDENSKTTTLYDFLLESEGDNPVTSYNLWLFPDEKEEVMRIKELETSNYALSSEGWEKTESCLSLLTGFQIFIFPFLLASFLVAAFLIYSLAASYFYREKKESAILRSLGAKKSSLYFFYLQRVFILSLSAAIMALFCSYPLSLLFSSLLFQEFQIHNLATIPYLSAFNIPFFPIIGALLLSIILNLGGYGIPLFFSLRNSLQRELQDE